MIRLDKDEASALLLPVYEAMLASQAHIGHALPGTPLAPVVHAQADGWVEMYAQMVDQLHPPLGTREK